jgi:hypothetical protein
LTPDLVLLVIPVLASFPICDTHYWAFLTCAISTGMTVVHACEMGTFLGPLCHSPYNKYGILMIVHASHKSNPSSAPQGYVEMVTGVKGVP